MSHSIEPFLDTARCEAVIEAIGRFVDREYHATNIRTRRAHVYEYGLDLEAFAFPVHCPGSPRTDAFPGFTLDELPEPLPELTRRAVERLGVERGRVLWNVARYAQHSAPLPAHFDGELFEFEPDPVAGNTVWSGIRPRQVALLTLRNESAHCGTTLHAADGSIVRTRSGPGELLVFDNVETMHGVPGTGDNVVAPAQEASKRWIRVTTGWRAMDEGFDWDDRRALRPIDFEASVAKHAAFFEKRWPTLAEADVARATPALPPPFRLSARSGARIVVEEPPCRTLPPMRPPTRTTRSRRSPPTCSWCGDAFR